MVDNRHYTDNFIIYSSSIASEYCKKYGYDFYYIRPFLDENFDIYNCLNPLNNNKRHASWSKLLGVKHIVEKNNYNTIFYLDTDCIFTDFNTSLEEFLINTHKEIFFFNNKPYGGEYNNTLPCAGVFGFKIKNRENIINFINKWFHTQSNDIQHAWEQDALWKFYEQHLHEIDIIDTWMFKEYDGQFIRHVGFPESHIRYERFKNEYLKHNISDINIKYIELKTN
jgi:hypothetical protein